MNTVIIEFTLRGAGLLRELGVLAREAGLWTWWVRFTATRTYRHGHTFLYELETDADPVSGGNIVLAVDSVGTPLITASWDPPRNSVWRVVNGGNGDWVQEPAEGPHKERNVAVFPTDVLTNMFALFAGTTQEGRVAA